MKKSKVCTKCEGINIWIKDGAPFSASDKINIGWNNIVSVIRYICLDCGFIEDYMDINDIDDKKMGIIQKKWKPLNKHVIK